MKDETSLWLKYAKENLDSAILLLGNNLFNPCLQNIQQCIEKTLKAVLIEKNHPLRRTHSINELRNIIESIGIQINLSEDDCDFFDSVYLPSKYPVSSVIPDFNPDRKTCNNAIKIGVQLFNAVNEII